MSPCTSFSSAYPVIHFWNYIPQPTAGKWNCSRTKRVRSNCAKLCREIYVSHLHLFFISGTYRTSYFAPGTTPMPDCIRSEVGLIKNDFNMRLKQVAFNSICSAYYAAFIPCAFATVSSFLLFCVSNFKLIKKKHLSSIYMHFRVPCITSFFGFLVTSFCASSDVVHSILFSATQPVTSIWCIEQQITLVSIF